MQIYNYLLLDMMTQQYYVTLILDHTTFPTVYQRVTYYINKQHYSMRCRDLFMLLCPTLSSVSIWMVTMSALLPVSATVLQHKFEIQKFSSWSNTRRVYYTIKREALIDIY